MIRPFDWRDLTILHRYRNQGLCLNSALGLTRGKTISPTVLLSYLTPATGFFTWIITDDNEPLLGQLNHPADSHIARVSFLAPEKGIKNSKAQILLEHLAKQAGKRGAFHLLAEVDELAPAYEVLRQAGFGIYARQRIWKILEEKEEKNSSSKWLPIKDHHTIAVQNLFHNVVPGIVGQVESLPTKHLQGMVCFKNDDLIGYVDFKYGYHGIWTQPFIHPDVENIDDHLISMINSISDRRSRSIYLCVRSYQSWLEPALGEMKSQSSPLQAVMVKRLAARQKLALQAMPSIEGQTEISAPYVQSQSNNRLFGKFQG
jgi:hypothetical protein